MQSSESILILAALIAIVFTCTPARAANPPESLELEAWLAREETSKDSNWSRFTVSIHGNTMAMTREYGGFQAPDKEERTRELTPEAMDKVRELIRSMGLDQAVTEIQPMEGLGIAQELWFEITGPAASCIHLAGRTHIWGKDAGERETNLEHIELVRKAEWFFNTLWTLE